MINEKMNPFDKLRRTIDKAQLNYIHEPTHTTTVETYTTHEISKLKENYEQHQVASMDQLTGKSKEIQLLTKALRRAELSNESLIAEAVGLEKENQLLKLNLQGQYQASVAHEEKQRKYRQEISRINMTVNELASEINSERVAKRQLQKESEAIKEQINRKEEELRQITINYKGQSDRLKCQLKERMQMFEYHVRKNTDERVESNARLQSTKEQLEAAMRQLRREGEEAKIKWMMAEKEVEITLIKKNSLELELGKAGKQIIDLREEISLLKENVSNIENGLAKMAVAKSCLEVELESVRSELTEERQKEKVKIIEIRDEALELQLEMYRKQCRELMQQKAASSFSSRVELKLAEQGR